ncbi:MAG: PepSY domain-containing protein [Rhizomicrobium sp.]|jgi:uncharacterized membrane protein YkoI
MKHLKRLTYAAAFLAVALPGAALAWSGENLAPRAKITMEQATAIALKERPGTVTDRELEREGGGSGLRYSFDIKSDGVVYEVGVDAKSGKVLEDSKEGPHPD